MFCSRRDRFTRNLQRWIAPSCERNRGTACPASQLLRQPPVRLQQLIENGIPVEFSPSNPAIDLASLETTVKYAGYLRRQEAEIERARREERCRIPGNFEFEKVSGLSGEVVQRLSQIRPDTVGHALRVPGVTPAAAALVAAHIARLRPGA